MTQRDPENNDSPPTDGPFPDYFHIVPIERGEDRTKWKAPQTRGWNDDRVAIHYPNSLYDGYNGGICHKQSGTCAIDIDNLIKCRVMFSERSIDLNKLLMAGCQISSGRENRSKLLYRLPPEIIMLGAYPKLRQIAETDGMVMEFRCVYGTGKTCQDVAPFSIHPDTDEHYKWNNPNDEIPIIPAELLKWWYELIPKTTSPAESAWTGVDDNFMDRVKITRALNVLSPDIVYPEWRNVGLALHDTGWSDAFELWDEWSSGGYEYDFDLCVDKWDDMTAGGGINITWLYALAYQYDKNWDRMSEAEMLDSVQGQVIDHETQQPVPDAQAMGDPQRIVTCRNGGHPALMAEHLELYIHLCSVAAGCQMPESRTACIDAIARVFGIRRQSDVRDRVESFTTEITSSIDPEIISRYFHIKTMHKFYDRLNMTLISAEALNQSWNSGDEQAQASFKEAGGWSVDELTWQPCPYVGQAEEIVHQGHLTQVNTYQKPEDVPNMFAGMDVTPYITHTEFLIPDPLERMAVLDHMAYTMQHPDQKIDWQILLFGEQGTGKDTLLLPLADYFRTMYRDIKAGDDNANQWGDTFFRKKVLVYQEVFRPRDKKFSNELKTLASSTAGGRDELNLKGKGQVSQPNLYSMYMFSNHRDPLHIEEGDRRIFPVGDHDIKQPQEAYFDYLYDWLDDKGGRLGVVYWLLHRDISQFKPKRMPFHTRAREEIIDHSRSESQLAIEEELTLKRGVFAAHVSCFTAKMLCKNLTDRGERFTNASALSQELSKMKFVRLGKTKQMTGGVSSTIRLWVNPNYSGHEEGQGVVYDDLENHGGRLKAYTRCGYGV